jgi:DNA replication and repair protein RecF
MKMSRLHLRDFRNYKDLKVEFSPRLNIFIGDNGQGKSNLLEAIALLSLNESFRYADNENLIRFDAQAAFIEGDLDRNGLDYKVKMQILKSRKNVTWNEKKITQTSIREHFSCVVFSPESLSFIKEASDERRTLIDEALISVDPLAADLVTDFRKALKTRNKVLKDYLAEETDKKSTLAVLESLNPLFLSLASQLTLKRIQLLGQMRSGIQEAMEFISKKSVDISVEYRISGENFLQKASEISLEEVNNALHQRMLQLRDAELASGASLVGPHKHEIVFLYDQKDSRFYCSQGQQRALILSFKMAQIVYYYKLHEAYPILLLDDVLSELDFVKRGALIEFLQSIKTQIFLTTTDLHLPEELRMDEAKVFVVKDLVLKEVAKNDID